MDEIKLIIPDASEDTLQVVCSQIQIASTNPNGVWDQATASLDIPLQSATKNATEVLAQVAVALPIAIKVVGALKAFQDLVKFVQWCQELLGSLHNKDSIEVVVNGNKVVIRASENVEVVVIRLKDALEK